MTGAASGIGHAIMVAQLDRMYAVNLRGPLLVARAALPHLPDGRRIINIVPERAYLGRAGACGYVATKAGLLEQRQPDRNRPGWQSSSPARRRRS